MTNHPLPADYAERVYAGWLGKCIGVRFGAPLEGWTYEEIRDNLGTLHGYVVENKDKVFKPDDDTSVPMIYIRALEDFGTDLTSQRIADTILNYVGYEHGSYWWGGYGNSTAHTAYLNLANGIPAPRSGSIAQNGTTVAEQIGGQIFSDIWGLVAPNNPAQAADLAECASRVTHDGNGVYGGRFLAAMISAAFSESQPERLIEIGLQHIPTDSDYARVINAMRDFYHAHPTDWHEGFAYLKAHFGYDRYPGAVPIVPNAGVMALGFLYGEGDFSRTLQITNMAGWDTDCNVGNVGTVMGVACGLDGIDASWRDPMNDLLITASLIGTRNILTIPQCVDLFVRLAKEINKFNREPAPPRYHFRYRGSTNNFHARGQRGRPIHLYQTTVDGESVLGTAIRKLNKKGEICIFTRTYYQIDELSGNYYGAAFTPLIYSGQTVTARVRIPENAPETIRAAIFVQDCNKGESHQAVGEILVPGSWHTLTFAIPALTDACLSEVGIVLRNTGPQWDTGVVHLAELDWSGTPQFKSTFAHTQPQTGAISEWTYWRGYWRIEDGAYCGSGPLESESYTGDINWTDYTLSVQLTPILGDYHLVNVRVQGAQRSYAFGLSPDNTITLYKKNRDYHAIQSAPFAWQPGEHYHLIVKAQGNALTATIENVDQTQSQSITWEDTDTPYRKGQIGLSTWYGSHTRYAMLQVSGN